MLSIPSTFKRTKRCPNKEELRFLHNIVKKLIPEDSNILEFGCGITTLAITQALKGEYRYIAVEQFKVCIKPVKQHIETVEFITTDWNDIPEIEYDLIFVDSSTGAPPKLAPVDKKIFRKDSIKFSEPMLKENGYMITHDWNYHRPQWKNAARYPEKLGMTLVDSLESYFGLGVYQKVTTD